MIAFLLDTLLWTGALIALVLLLRRPVARHFGARTAYALWTLPMARLLLPPVVLPAWMGGGEPASLAAAVPGEALTIPVARDLGEGIVAAPATATMPSPVDFVVPLIALWLVGAAMFLVRRFGLYFRMRRELLAAARPVGEVGDIRIVETAGAEGPVAFGVLDKVVVLPVGMIASRDRATRDLAIAHEVAHHRGHDLLVNILVQPLFALHWFNPLGWAGWKALRRDQEAACDARVVDRSSREERARYAGVIADFATARSHSSRHALAAPMACPVLGDKSIVHRLRSLTMNDISARRRVAARALLGTSVLALPLTASISYAKQDPVEAPPAAEAPAEDVGAVSTVGEVEGIGTVGTPPSSLYAEPSSSADRQTFERVEREIGNDGEERVVRRTFSFDGKDFAQMPEFRGWSEEDRAEFERDMQEMRETFAENGEFSREMRQFARDMAHDGKVRRQMRVAINEARAASAAGAFAAAHAVAMAPKVVMECKGEDSPVTSRTDADGSTTLYVCETFGRKVSLGAVRSARATIERDAALSREERTEALRALDEAIAELSN
ncbi:M56 family metallopeptidase [Qipengyuania spongiae]|uniref:M56 family metallopeptidase n=1 Tax=Qipengyuania spongiae TaxID=2909673 RepID=A0ABY5SX34_9SPHN|nr:M56 family metallopeptidase [Qipengyuania spongiae]UVI38720.1 M56 family metallopeptidase [Qipengyuania spongiae]